MNALFPTRRCVIGAALSLSLIGRQVAQAAQSGADDIQLPSGQIIQLSGIRLPRREEHEGWAARARVRADQLAAGVEEVMPDPGPNRWGVMRARPRLKDGAILQDMLLAEGLARVATNEDTDSHAQSLLAAEAPARVAQRGLWQEPVFAIRQATARIPIGGFEVIEGHATRLRRGRDVRFLDFGTRRGDFSLVIEEPAYRALMKSGDDPKDWAGRLLRMRGITRWLGGPALTLTHRAMVEALD